MYIPPNILSFVKQHDRTNSLSRLLLHGCRCLFLKTRNARKYGRKNSVFKICIDVRSRKKFRLLVTCLNKFFSHTECQSFLFPLAINLMLIHIAFSLKSSLFID